MIRPSNATDCCGVNVIAVAHVVAKVKSTGWEFASTRNDGEPLKFTVGAERVCRGLDTAVATMKPGERVRVTCSGKYVAGFPGAPLDEICEFDVELLEVYRGDDDIVTHSKGTVDVYRVALFVLVFIFLLHVLQVQRAQWELGGGDDRLE